MTPPEKLEDAAVLFFVALFLYATQRIQSSKTNKKVEETSNKLDEAKIQVEAAKEQVDNVNSTLTSNNGGSTVKDKLDQILSNQAMHDLKFKYIEAQQDNIQAKQDRQDAKQDRQDAKLDAVDKKVNDHIHNGIGRKKKRSL